MRFRFAALGLAALLIATSAAADPEGLGRYAVDHRIGAHLKAMSKTVTFHERALPWPDLSPHQSRRRGRLMMGVRLLPGPGDGARLFLYSDKDRRLGQADASGYRALLIHIDGFGRRIDEQVLTLPDGTESPDHAVAATSGGVLVITDTRLVRFDADGRMAGHRDLPDGPHYRFAAPTADDGFVIWVVEAAAESGSPELDTWHMRRLDAGGNILWSARFEKQRFDVGVPIVAQPDGDVAVWSLSGIAAFDVAGKERWHRAPPPPPPLPSVAELAEEPPPRRHWKSEYLAPGPGSDVYAADLETADPWEDRFDSMLRLRRIAAGGMVRWERRFPWSEPLTDLTELREFLPMRDGVLIVLETGPFVARDRRTDLEEKR